MGKPTLKIGRRKPRRELNPMEQWRRKQKEKKHVKDYVRKLKKKQEQHIQETPNEDSSSDSEETPEPVLMKPLTLHTSSKPPKATPAPISKPDSSQAYFKSLLSEDKKVSDFFKEIQDLL